MWSFKPSKSSDFPPSSFVPSTLKEYVFSSASSLLIVMVAFFSPNAPTGEKEIVKLVKLFPEMKEKI